MLHRSDMQGRPLIQVLILRGWADEEVRRNLLINLGGIVVGEEDSPIKERIDQIEEVIRSLQLGSLDDHLISAIEAAF
jgi:hypothetical protein